MAKTYTMTVNNAGDPEPVIIQSRAIGEPWPKKVIILEDPTAAGWPTTAVNMRAPLSTDVAIPYGAGEPIVLETDSRPGYVFAPGQTIAHLATVSGSITMRVLELP
jgi:hypothetical protein